MCIFQHWLRNKDSNTAAVVQHYERTELQIIPQAVNAKWRICRKCSSCMTQKLFFFHYRHQYAMCPYAMCGSKRLFMQSVGEVKREMAGPWSLMFFYLSPPVSVTVSKDCQQLTTEFAQHSVALYILTVSQLANKITLQVNTILQE